jgi:hypothetical protein
MITASRPVTSSDTTEKTPSFTPAASVTALRRWRRRATDRDSEQRPERAVLVGGDAVVGREQRVDDLLVALGAGEAAEEVELVRVEDAEVRDHALRRVLVDVAAVVERVRRRGDRQLGQPVGAPGAVADLAVLHEVALVEVPELGVAELEVLLHDVARERPRQDRRVVGGAPDQAGEPRGVLREQREHRLGHLAHPDQVLLVRREQPGRGVGEAGEVGEEHVEVVGLLADRLAGDGDVLEHVEQVGRRQVVGVGDVGEGDQVLPQGRQVVVDHPEVLAQVVHRRADLLATALERGRQRVERRVEVGRTHGPQQREQVGEDLAELDVGGDPVGRDHVAVLERVGGGVGGSHELDELLAEERRGQDLHRDVGGDLPRRVRPERDLDLGLLAVLRDPADLPDEGAVEAHVAELGELEARPVGPDRDRGDPVELLVVDGDRQPDEQAHHHDERDAGQQQPVVLLGGVVVDVDEHQAVTR